ncbi:hypothetical protein [Couchioplanes azureus]|uniref:hypothetical protein n=1 Tax=Couchioplanes caeruleus TaxID=56438 RepID=UPI00166F795B|nr:hypothetical protein [Couchioplanes caeruleus]GGQ70167.1 hypothetical protein GCM10010166_45020 [Couchioplanes caeruleus subsp. azureus]
MKQATGAAFRRARWPHHPAELPGDLTGRRGGEKRRCADATAALMLAAARHTRRRITAYRNPAVQIQVATGPVGSGTDELSNDRR